MDDTSIALEVTTQQQREEEAIAQAERHQIPRAVVRICATIIDNVRGEEDLEEKPLRNLIAKLQENDPFVARKWLACEGHVTCKNTQETQGQWHA